MSQTKIRIISTIIFILFGCVLFVALPAVIFKHIEGWNTLDAIYFVVITLTTIGFGDYVAGNVLPSSVWKNKPYSFIMYINAFSVYIVARDTSTKPGIDLAVFLPSVPDWCFL